MLHSPAKRFPGSSAFEYSVNVVEVCEIGVYLEDPIGLSKYDCPYIKQGHSTTQKRLILHPRDDIVQTPRHVQSDSGNRKIPAVCWFLCENESAVAHAKD